MESVFVEKWNNVCGNIARAVPPALGTGCPCNGYRSVQAVRLERSSCLLRAFKADDVFFYVCSQNVVSLSCSLLE